VRPAANTLTTRTVPKMLEELEYEAQNNGLGWLDWHDHWKIKKITQIRKDM